MYLSLSPQFDHPPLNLPLSITLIFYGQYLSGGGGGWWPCNMEAPSNVAAGDLSGRHVVKGTRTKRQRPHSPIPPIITLRREDDDDNDDDVINNPDPLPTDCVSIKSEDEETANCLILLAQGRHRFITPKNNIGQRDIDHHRDSYHREINDDQDYKFNSKRYIETSSTSGNKAGIFVYECKTCSRTFPSFQALGGHRASHKKPKNMPKKPFILSDSEDDFTFSIKKNDIKTPSPPFQPINKKKNSSFHAFKVHECSYCGAEFTSGQALGGHMRRHRGGGGGGALVVGPNVANTTLSLSTPMSQASYDYYNQESEESKKTTRNSLSLDLNLPAPEDEHKQQQQKGAEFVFSTSPALVDCHY